MNILYSTGCVQCIILKKKLESKGIKFKENTDRETMLRLNFVRVPVLEVDGKYMNFNEAIKWVDMQEESK